MDKQHNPNDFSHRLVALRKMHGMTQSELAEASGIGLNTIARYETGERLPRIDSFGILADTLGCSMDVLAGRTPLFAS